MRMPLIADGAEIHQDSGSARIRIHSHAALQHIDRSPDLVSIPLPCVSG